MKIAASVAVLAVAVLLLLLDCHAVSAARLGHHPRGQGHHSPRRGHHRHATTFPLFVFGDDYADTGNLPQRDDAWPALARQWAFPYGGDGRFSDGKVQPDFLANLLGHAESPPPARALGHHHGGGRSGINFAVGGSGVFGVPQEVATLAAQVESFAALVQVGSVVDVDDTSAVALVAVSGHDYDRITVSRHDTAAFADLARLVEGVTDGIAAAAARLRDELGVQRVVVNNLFPLGCAPALTRAANYTACEELANHVAALHNRRLADKLAGMDGVLVLDVSEAFTAIVKHHGDGGGEVAQRFAHKLTPCCESLDAGGYCGLRSADGTAELYTVCDRPEEFFFWDEVHPTDAGWAAVMAQLKAPLMDFLGLA